MKKNIFTKYAEDFLHLFFPHNCIGCATDVLNNEDELCAKCTNSLPVTGFISAPQNPVEKMFYGRINVECAGSAFYFTKNSLLQQLIIQIKYQHNLNACLYLGKILGRLIQQSGRFNDIDIIVPLPLNDKRLYKRGYNQSLLLAGGMAEAYKKPVIKDAVERNINTETQTHKNRVTRWQTMENAFAVRTPQLLQNKHVLLVDDIVTTGATLEACGAQILKTPGARLSIVTLAYTI